MYTLVHAAMGYFLLLLIVRVLTRRPGAQMTQFEFVIVFLIGGVIILSTVGNDRSVTNCTCAVMFVGLLHRMMGWLKSKNPQLGALIDGTPLVLRKHGKWQDEVMRGMKLAPEDVMAAARSKGISSLEEIDFAVLERNGAISVIKKEEGSQTSA